MHKAGNIQWANGWAARDRPNFANKRLAPGRRGNNESKTATKGDKKKKE